MSARQMRRLRELLEQQKSKVEEQSEEEVEEEEEEEVSAVNAFSAFANSDSTDENEEEEEEEDDIDETEEEKIEVVKSKEEKEKEDMDFLDGLLSANYTNGETTSEIGVTDNTDSNFIDLSAILSINAKKLNDMEETNQKFGGNQEEEEGGRGFRNRQRQLRRNQSSLKNISVFITPNETNVKPPSFIGGGFCFQSVNCPFNFDQGCLTHLDNQAVFYNMKCSPEYSALVEEYKTYCMEYTSEAIGDMAMQFYGKHPYLLHVAYDLTRIMLLYKDSNQVFTILRQCLYIIEKAFGTMVDITSGSIRLLYSEKDNQMVYSILHLYIQLCSRKACFETALNASLLVYSLFPQVDPKGALFYIDYFAICLRRWSFIQQFVESGITIGSLPILMLPNWAFSYAIALYRLNKKEEAEKQMITAVKQYPSVLQQVDAFSKASLHIPSSLKEHDFFNLVNESPQIVTCMGVFITRQVQVLSNSEIWTLLIESYKTMISSTTTEEMNRIQEELRIAYEGLAEFFTNLKVTADIEDNLFTINLEDYNDDLPTINVDQFLRERQGRNAQHGLEAELAARRIPNNIPVDHNLVRLFLEAMQPGMNANELNDDEVAAIMDQMNELMEVEGGLEGVNVNDGWQEDWNSDEE